MPGDPFENPVWNALHSVHSGLAVGDRTAVAYPADVAPFAALADTRHSDLVPLEPLIAPGDHVYIIGAEPQPTKNLRVGPVVPCLQMFLNVSPTVASSSDSPASLWPQSCENIPPILRMTPADAPDMVALTDLAFPGFFRPRTYAMGTYYGVRLDGQLVAMAGERLAVDEYRELSAVCTHPNHVGRGYARRLMHRLIRDHAEAGLKSYLHVRTNNSRAIPIYERMGFAAARTVTVWPIFHRQ
jgi:GNAT superfamily N-acetyltransferase